MKMKMKMVTFAVCIMAGLQVLGVSAFAAYKIPKCPLPATNYTREHPMSFVPEPQVPEKNAVQTTINLKEAYDLAKPSSENAMAIRPIQGGIRDLSRLNSPTAQPTEQELEYLWPRMNGSQVRFRYLLDKSAPDVVHLNIPLTEKYPDVMLDNIVSYRGKIFLLLKEVAKLDDEGYFVPHGIPSIDIYNTKTGETMGINSAEMHGIDGHLYIQFLMELYQPEDLENLVLTYDKTEFSTLYGK